MDIVENEGTKMMTIRQIAKLGILSENAIRRLVKEKKIPVMYSGNRCLINYKTFLEYLDTLPTPTS